MRDKLVFLTIVTAFIAVVTAWFFASYEKTDVETRTDASAQVKANNYYGFGQYLKHLNIDSHRLIDLNTRTQLPPYSDTLLFDINTAGITEVEQNEILSWVAAGGQLALEIPYDPTNSLLGRMGFDRELYEDEEEEPAEEEPTSEAEDSQTEPQAQLQPSIQRLPNFNRTDQLAIEENQRDENVNNKNSTEDPAGIDTQNTTLGELLEQLNAEDTEEADKFFVARLNGVELGEIQFPYLFSDSYLGDRPISWIITAHEPDEPDELATPAESEELAGSAELADSVELAELAESAELAETAEPDEPDSAANNFAFGFQYGLGFVSVIGETYQATNQHFFKQDNAFVMMTALTQNRHPGKIWIISSVTRPSLWKTLWQRGAHLILWLLLGVVFFFWWAGKRTGRMEPDPAEERREFFEHIAASGRYLWHHDQRQTLLRQTRNAFYQKLYKRVPHLRDADASEKRHHMRQIAGTDKDLWDIAIQEHDEISRPQFLEQISAIQKLWKII